MEYYVVYTRRMARELIKQGFNFIKTEIDNKNPRYDVYLFQDCEEIRKAVKILSNR